MMTNNVVEDSIGGTLIKLASRLEKTSETPDLDAQNLLAHLLDKSRSWVLAHPESSLDRTTFSTMEKFTSRLEAGEPLPYVLGQWEFYGLEFELTPEVLIPRPETELLVETSLAWLHMRPDSRRVADVGTGSGCIGITLAVNIPDLQVEAMDISSAAVEVARRNASRHGVTKQMEFSCGDLLSGQSYFNLIVANLPYIPTSTLQQLPLYGHEPTLALDGGADGMVLIRRLMKEAPAHILPGGMLLLEIEASEGEALKTFARKIFPKAQICLTRDLSGYDRLMEIQL